jgi:hypothetical protein
LREKDLGTKIAFAIFAIYSAQLFLGYKKKLQKVNIGQNSLKRLFCRCESTKQAFLKQASSERAKMLCDCVLPKNVPFYRPSLLLFTKTSCASPS